MKQTIKTGFCVAYDWHMLAHSLPLIYNDSSAICLSLDNQRTSWSMNKFQFDEAAFHALIARIDIDKKIDVYEDNFHLPSLTPMQNEVRQRNLMASRLGAGGWHIQLDCDEYFLGFDNFVKFLHSLPGTSADKINVSCPWVVLYKQVNGGFLYVDPVTTDNLEFMQVATRHPVYEYGRRNGNFNIHTNFLIIHQSWAREETEIRQKIYNWGHSTDVNRDGYLQLWKSLNGENFSGIQNFHPVRPAAWPKLKFIAADNITDFIDKFDAKSFPKLSKTQRLFKNSLFFSRLRRITTLFRGQ